MSDASGPHAAKLSFRPDGTPLSSSSKTVRSTPAGGPLPQAPRRRHRHHSIGVSPEPAGGFSGIREQHGLIAWLSVTFLVSLFV
jgi:hypothetical protein